MGEEHVWKCAETLQFIIFFYFFYFGLRGHNEFQSLECYQFVAGEDSSGKYIEFTGRSTKNFKEGLAHWKLYNKQIRHYGQPGKSYSVYKTVSFITLSVENIGFAPFISLLT